MESKVFSKSSLAQAIMRQGRPLNSVHRALEKRILLDATVAVDASQSLTAVAEENAAAQEADTHDVAAGESQENEALAAGSTARNELVVIDLQLDDAQALVDNLLNQADKVEQGESTLYLTIGERSLTLLAIDIDDSLQTVTDFISQSGQAFDALHLVSHGDAAGIAIGGEELSLTSVGISGDGSHSAQLQSWQANLSADADILLYGCNTAFSATGEQFIEQFAALTGSDVAASDDATGSARLGGDWELEQQRGNVETDIVFSKLLQGEWDGLMAAGPANSLDVPAEDLINETTTITVSFENTGTDTGYAPVVDTVLGPGLVPQSVSGGGLNLPFETYTFTAGAWTDSSGAIVEFHPCDTTQSGQPPLAADSVEGATWLAITLPFGSYSPNQPAFEIDISVLIDESAGAMVGVPIAVSSRPAFCFGEDALNNPDVDPPIVGPTVSDSITPTVLLVDKEASDGDGDNQSINDDNETVTGPSEPVVWQVNVNLANLATVENLVITDQIPADFFYQGNVSVTGAAGPFVQGTDYTLSEPPLGVSNNGELVITFLTPVTGTLSATDIVVTFDGYVPDVDADGNPIVINDGADQSVRNQVAVQGNYQGMSVTDGDSDIFTAVATAMQKKVDLIQDGGGAGPTPGDRLLYTLSIQVSDYVQVDSLNLADLLDDGLDYIDGSAEFELFVNGTSIGPDPFFNANVSVTENPDPGDGSTELVFDLSQELIDRGVNNAGTLDGDLFADAISEGTTTIVVTYEAEIRENYIGAPLAGTPNESVDTLDNISNSASVSGNLSSAGGQVLDNGSSETITVGGADSSKAVFAVNGSMDPQDVDEVRAGDLVTFAVRVDLSSFDNQGLSITDYLPLPVFQAANPTYVDTSSGTNLPGVNQWGFGPNTDFSEFPPGYLDPGNVTTSVSTGDNAINWLFDPVSQDASNGGSLEILFTVEALDAAFADGLFITNVAQVAIGNTNGTVVLDPDTAPLEVLSPDLNITKGIVSTDNPGGTLAPDPAAPVTFDPAGTPADGNAPWTGTITSQDLDLLPIDSNLDDVDAGDLVRFVLTVENTGGADAFDVAIVEDVPNGFVFPAGSTNLQVFNGAGDEIPFTGNLFGSGLILTDPQDTDPNNPNGALESGRDANNGQPTDDGTNLVIIAFDLEVEPLIRANETVVNETEIDSFAAVNGGNNFTLDEDTGQRINDPKWDDDATTDIRENAIAKRLVGTSINTPNNANNEAVIGELITYELTLTLAEGETPSASIFDRLDNGLEFVEITDVTVSTPDISSSVPLTPAGLDPQQSGRNLTFDLGDLTNTNRDNNVDETITITYVVRVENINGNQSGDRLNNRATFNWDDTDDGVDNPVGHGDVSAARVTVIEPDLQVTKDLIAPTGSIDAGDAITYQIVIQHSGNSDTDAYDSTFTDTLPPELNTVSNLSVIHSSLGDITNRFQIVGNTVETIPGQDFDVLLGETVTIEVDAIVNDDVAAGTVVVNEATAEWTSIDGPSEFERTGVDAPNGPNDYANTGSESFTTLEIIADDKLIINSSIDTPNNGIEEVTIGEEATYQATFEIPEGDVPLAQIVDSLPPGLEFVSLDEVLVSGPITSDRGDLTDPATLDPPPEGTTGDILFLLGNLTNPPDGSSEPDLIVLIYTVRAQNVASNQGGADLTNTATATFDSNGNGIIDPDDSATSVQSTIGVVEPDLQVEKTELSNPSDNGDGVNYRITITAATGQSASEAYDVVFSDPIPPQVGVTAFIATLNSGGSQTDITGEFELVGDTLRTVANANITLAPGDFIEINISGVLSDTLAGETISNTGTADWTSLPGDDTNERDGSDGEGGLNDYIDSGSADFQIANPLFEKRLVETSQNDDLNDNDEATIGEFVTFEMVITLPEAELVSSITDTYDEGFEFIDLVGVVASNPGAIEGDLDSIVAVNDPANNQVTFDLGTLKNTNLDNSTVETLTITYRLRVLDIPQNTAGDILGNSAELSYDTDRDETLDTTIQDADEITVVEPELLINKEIISGTPIELGTTVEYRLTVELAPDATANAYDVIIEDSIPFQLNLDPDSVEVVVTDTNGTRDITTLSSRSVPSFILADIPEIGPDTLVTITYRAEVTTDPAAQGTIAINEMAVFSSSLEDGRTGSDPERLYVDLTTESAQIVGIDLAVTKDDGGISAQPGDTVVYTIDYANLGDADSTGVVITDTLPDFVTFDSGNSSAGWILNGNTLTFDVGDLNAGESGTLQLAVIVDAPVPAGLEELLNSVEIEDDGTNGTELDDTNNADEDNTPIIAAPDYVIDKVEQFADPANPGDTLEWTIEVSNQGNQDGTGVMITDTLPDTDLFASFTASNGGVVDLVAGTVTWDIGDLAAGDSITLTLTGVVADSVPVTIPTQTNTVEVTDDGSNGPDPTPENNTDSEDFDITYVDMAIDKDDGGISAEPGDTVVFNLTYRNNGTADAEGVVITETLPPNTTFDAANSSAGWVQNGDVFTLDIGSVAAGEEGTVQFAVIVDEPLPNGVIETSNTATIEDDGGSGPDQNTNNNEDNEQTPLVAAPDYVIDKIEQFADPANPGDTLEWTIEVSNQGNQDGTGVMITDTLPDTDLFASFTASNGGVVDLVAGTVTWDI
ncbi:isopeptide-forming domain-containing fimbrial protein, partial [Microbulbifer agarilyticus]